MLTQTREESVGNMSSHGLCLHKNSEGLPGQASPWQGCVGNTSGPRPLGVVRAELAQKALQLPVSSSGTLTPPAHLSLEVETGKDMSAVCPMCSRASFGTMNLFYCQSCKASTHKGWGLVMSVLKWGLIQGILEP